MHAPLIVVGEALAALHGELLLFAAAFFAIGMLDELAVDGLYFWNRLKGRIRTGRVDENVVAMQPLSGIAAVFIPA